MRGIEAQRAKLRAAQTWLLSLERVDVDTVLSRGVRPSPGRTAVKDPRNADSVMTATALTDALDDYARTSSLEGERQAVAEREAEEREADARREQIAAFRGAHPPLHVR